MNGYSRVQYGESILEVFYKSNRIQEYHTTLFLLFQQILINIRGR